MTWTDEHTRRAGQPAKERARLIEQNDHVSAREKELSFNMADMLPLAVGEIERLRRQVKAMEDADGAELAALRADREISISITNEQGTQLACAADLANSWAREIHIDVCEDPYRELSLRNLIDILWDKTSADLRAEKERLDWLLTHAIICLKAKAPLFGYETYGALEDREQIDKARASEEAQK